MCGIVGLFLKDHRLEPALGAHLASMLVTMSDRGPDSAGLALYGPPADGTKLVVRAEAPEALDGLAATLEATGVSVAVKADHAVLGVPPGREAAVRAALPPDVRVLSAGTRIEIYKAVGRPAQVVDRFGIARTGGSHGIGHTRMATESAVTTLGSHPFSTGADQCLVHNGSLSNHNMLRRRLRRAGIGFETENDSEVAAAFVSDRLAAGEGLEAALTAALDELDGFYTFVVGTRQGFGVLRDPIACKPAVMGETDAWVAFGSEYRALAVLPGVEHARIWEPEPARVYVWEH